MGRGVLGALKHPPSRFSWHPSPNLFAEKTLPSFFSVSSLILANLHLTATVEKGLE